MVKMNSTLLNFLTVVCAMVILLIAGLGLFSFVKKEIASMKKYSPMLDMMDLELKIKQMQNLADRTVPDRPPKYVDEIDVIINQIEGKYK